MTFTWDRAGICQPGEWSLSLPELREGFVSLGSAGGTPWAVTTSLWAIPELLVLSLTLLCFHLQALWGWQQLLLWQRGRKGSDLTFLSPTPPSGRGSRHVCSGEHSPVPATSKWPLVALCGHTKYCSEVHPARGGFFLGASFWNPRVVV